MTREEHRKFKREADKSIGAVCGHIFRGETLTEEELGTHADTLQKLYHEYNAAIEALEQVNSKVRWHFDENRK